MHASKSLRIGLLALVVFGPAVGEANSLRKYHGFSGEG